MLSTKSRYTTYECQISPIHSLLDLILIIYFYSHSQWIIVLLFVIIIILNLWNWNFKYLSHNLPMLREFTIDSFHSTAQLIPISISIAYYETDDIFIDCILLFIFLSFMYHVYTQSNKMSRDDDTNHRILQIIFLCILLDYIQVIILILTKLYFTNNFYFYKLFMSTYPVSIGGLISIIYRDVYRHGFKWYWDNFDPHGIWITFWILFALFIFFPLIGEFANAAWIIFLYNAFLYRYRHAAHFDEKLKDVLVKWLQRDKKDVLIKICCINHIKLRQQSFHYKQSLFTYLENNVECNRDYYSKVTWSQFKNASNKFNNVNLWNTVKQDICSFYDIDGVYHRLITNWNGIQPIPSGITKLGLHRLLQSVWYINLLIFFACYAVFKLANIFIWPLITLWIRYEKLTIDNRETYFDIIYFLLLLVILWRLYDLLMYEIILWYIIPDLDDLKCSKQDIDDFKTYYKYIKVDVDEIRRVLSDVFGKDVANIILVFTPDFLMLRSKQF